MHYAIVSFHDDKRTTRGFLAWWLCLFHDGRIPKYTHVSVSFDNITFTHGGFGLNHETSIECDKNVCVAVPVSKIRMIKPDYRHITCVLYVLDALDFNEWKRLIRTPDALYAFLTKTVGGQLL